MLQGQKPIYILFKSTELFMSWGEGGAPAGFVCCVCVCKVFSYWCLSSFSDANKAFLIFVISVWSCCMWCDVTVLEKLQQSHDAGVSHTHAHTHTEQPEWMSAAWIQYNPHPSHTHSFVAVGSLHTALKKYLGYRMWRKHPAPVFSFNRLSDLQSVFLAH